MTMKDDLEVGFLTSVDIAPRGLGNWFFETVLAFLPDAMPGKYGNFEPLAMDHRGDGVGNLAESWANPFLWSRKSPRVRGSAMFGKGIRHSMCQITLDSSKFEVSAVVDFLGAISERLPVDLGYIYLFSMEELEDRARYKKLMPFRRGVVTTDLLEGIPDVPPVMILGEPYIGLFGRDKILASPVASAVDLSGGSILLQVCEDIRASKDAFPEFDIKREKLKEHLGYEAFTDSSADTIRCPDFQFHG